MTGTPFIYTDDDRFPSYFRLFWNEVSDLIDPSKGDMEFIEDLAGILGKATNDDIGWFSYALKMFKDSETTTKQYAKDKHFGLRPPRKRTPTPEEFERDLNQKIKEVASILYKKTLSTFVWEAMYEREAILFIDGYIETNYPHLWNSIHLCGAKEDSIPVQTFFRHFFPERDKTLVDKLAVSFQNMNDIKVENLSRNMNGCRDLGKSLEHRIRIFIRELPKTPIFNDQWFYEIIQWMLNGDHMAALAVLLPDWDLVLKQKAQENQALRDVKRNIAPDEMVENDSLVLTPQEKYRERSDKIDFEDDPGTTLILRDYQEELVDSARKGNNTIVVAPTGAGKTEVCIYVARDHIEKREREGKGSRVVMLVPKIPLVEQQEARFRQYLRHKRIINGFHGSMNFTGKDRHDKVLKSDIVVMTPEILWNMFRTVRKSERIFLADISLLIFDEVHHCSENHVYNRIMQFIHDYPHPDVKPQILGVTATPLPKNRTDEKTSLEAIYKLMANADCYSLSTVVRHIESLEKQVAKPDEEFFKVNRHVNNPFEREVTMVIGAILNKIRKDLETLVKDSKSSGNYVTSQEARLAYSNAPAKFGSQLNGLRDKLNKMPQTTGIKMKLLVAVDYLLVITKSLALNELMPCYFAFDYLAREMDHVRDQYNNSISQDLYEAFSGVSHTLTSIVKGSKSTSDNQPQEDKPIVETLLDKIRSHFDAKPDSRCIIFVQERAMAKRLMKYLNEIRILDGYSLVAYVTSTKGGGGADGMTAEEQRSTLAKFHSGEIKIIVATSVLDEGIDVSACNLIIKYNTSSSAVSKIQRAGRVRAKGGKSIFLCLHDGVAESEYQAILTGNMMKKCVRLMLQSGPTQIRALVDDCKIKMAKEREHARKEEDSKKKRLQGERFDILCRICDKLICDSDNVRVDGSHFCIVDKKIWSNVGINVSFKKGAKFVDNEHQVLGTIFCIGHMRIEQLGNYYQQDEKPNMSDEGCGSRIGEVYKIAGTYFPVLKASEIKFRSRKSNSDGDRDATTVKNWKAATDLFFVPPLHEIDIRGMLNALKESPENQALMEIKLDAALERIAAQFSKELDRRRAEHERAERIRHAPKQKFAAFSEHSVNYLDNNAFERNQMDSDSGDEGEGFD